MYKFFLDRFFSTDVFLQNLHDFIAEKFFDHSFSIVIYKFSFLIDFSTFSQLTYFYKTCTILLRKNSSITASRLWCTSSFLIDFSTFSQLTYFYKNSSIITSWVFYFCNFEISVKISRSILIFIERFVMYKFFLDRFLDFFSTDVFTKLARFYFGKILRSQFFEYSIFEIIVKISRPILN